jgi:hypothetical protein
MQESLGYDKKNVDEGVLVREMSNIEYTTKDTTEVEDKQVQESIISF